MIGKIIGLLSLLFALVYGNAGWGFLLLCIGIIALFEYFFDFRKSNFFSPYSLMILSPLLLLKYSSITDFRIRVMCFILLIYLFNAAYKKSVREIKFSLLKIKPMTVWFTAFALFALAAVVIYIQGIHLSGDEPHYIMITQSLVEDGDFDLKNNFEEKTYHKYLPIDLRFHGGEYSDKYRSFHLPGVSFLLIPFYWLFGVLGGGKLIPPALYFRLAAAVINAFFALGLFLILKRKFPDRDITRFWLLFLIIFPLIFHSIHLYPELPAAALLMFAYFFTFFEKKNYLLAGLLLSFIPWFHVKYLPPLLVLAVAILYHLFKPFKPFKLFEKEKIKKLAQFVIFPVISLVLLVIYSKVLYGSYSPTDIFPKESYWSVSWLLRLKVFLAYFLDQRDGLLFYSPVFFLFFFSFKRRFQDRYLLLGILVTYVFFHAFTTVRGAYAPAGRPLIFVSWIFIIFIANKKFCRGPGDGFSKESPGRRRQGDHFISKVLLGLSLFVLVWLFYYPLFMYQSVFAGTVERASGLNLFLGSDFIHLWQLFPSFLTQPLSSHPANFVWIGILLVGLLLYYLKPLKTKTSVLTQPTAIIPFLLFLIFAFLYCFYPHVHLLSQNKHIDEVISFYNNSRNFRYIPDRNGFRIKSGNNYDIFIDRKMARKDKVTFHFTHMDVNDVTIRNGKKLLFQFKNTGKKEVSLDLQISSLQTLKVKNKLVSHVGIETRSRQKNSYLWLEITPLGTDL
ncbi:MAG: hypothetical protein PVH61_08540 [Candidatus Aminicenantes bacterium]|jgi:hypothetical protein